MRHLSPLNKAQIILDRLLKVNTGVPNMHGATNYQFCCWAATAAICVFSPLAHLQAYKKGVSLHAPRSI
ncbi:hypothetical protein ACTXT7_010621 [Hymenolepis weldensis]